MATGGGRRPAYDREAAEAARKATLESLHSQLAERIGSLDSLQAWGAWLRFANSFHRYSFNNTVLIWAQKPEATMVAGYRAWQAKGRQVRRGETAIKVFGPGTTREPTLDEHGRPVRGADGKPVLEVRIVGVKPVSVFDVSQTDGYPLPEPPQAKLLTGQAPLGLWDALQAFVEAQGYTVSRGDCGDANSITIFDSRQVRVRADIDDAAAVKTLAHEAGHVLLHAPEQRQPFACRGVIEVEAESVALPGDRRPRSRCVAVHVQLCGRLGAPGRHPGRAERGGDREGHWSARDRCHRPDPAGHPARSHRRRRGAG